MTMGHAARPFLLPTWRWEVPVGGRAFDLLSWNLLADANLDRGWYPRVSDQDLEPALRRRRLVSRLRELEADVMALQEVDTNLVPELVRAFPGHQLVAAPYGGEGLVVLLRGGGARVEAMGLAGGRKKALLVQLSGGWRLAVVHLSWSGAPRRSGPEIRRGSLQLSQVLSWEPDLLCGDFNAEPGWPERELPVQAGLVDATPSGPTCSVRDVRRPVDVMMHRPGWRVRAEPLPLLPFGLSLPSAEHPSDHLPLKLRLWAPQLARLAS